MLALSTVLGRVGDEEEFVPDGAGGAAGGAQVRTEEEIGVCFQRVHDTVVELVF